MKVKLRIDLAGEEQTLQFIDDFEGCVPARGDHFNHEDKLYVVDNTFFSFTKEGDQLVVIEVMPVLASRVEAAKRLHDVLVKGIEAIPQAGPDKVKVLDLDLSEAEKLFRHVKVNDLTVGDWLLGKIKDGLTVPNSVASVRLGKDSYAAVGFGDMFGALKDVEPAQTLQCEGKEVYALEREIAGKTFKRINEAWRSYHYGDSSVTLNRPEWLCVKRRDDGTDSHYVVCENGEVVYVRPGWNALNWKPLDPEYPISLI